MARPVSSAGTPPTTLNQLLPDGREKSLAMTNLEDVHVLRKRGARAPAVRALTTLMDMERESIRIDIPRPPDTADVLARRLIEQHRKLLRLQRDLRALHGRRSERTTLRGMEIDLHDQIGRTRDTLSVYGYGDHGEGTGFGE